MLGECNGFFYYKTNREVFRALAASCVLYNRTKHSQGFSICYKGGSLLHGDFHSVFEESPLGTWMTKFPACLELLSLASLCSSCSVAEHWQHDNLNVLKVSRIFSHLSSFFKIFFFILIPWFDTLLKIKDMWRIQVFSPRQILRQMIWAFSCQTLCFRACMPTSSSNFILSSTA